MTNIPFCTRSDGLLEPGSDLLGGGFNPPSNFFDPRVPVDLSSWGVDSTPPVQLLLSVVTSLNMRNRLAVSRINNLTMVSINGPPLRVFNARKYVISWIRSGRHTALDKPTGIASKEADVPLSATLLNCLYD